MRDRTVLSKTVHFSWAHAQSLSATQLRQFSTVLPGGRTFFAKISAKISYRDNESFHENLKFLQNFFVFAKSFTKIAYTFRENFLKNEKRRSALNFFENIVYFCKKISHKFLPKFTFQPLLAGPGNTGSQWHLPKEFLRTSEM
jgi:hypothetical protein